MTNPTSRSNSELPAPYAWIWMSEFEVGNFIHRWGDDLEILRLERGEGTQWILTVRETDGTEKTWTYPTDGEYIAKRKAVKE